MIKKNFEPGDIERKVHDLARAMNRVRSSQATRDDVVVEMKHAKISRLELLLEDLQPVIGAVPRENEQFEFALVRGENPRLWVDMTSFVRMGRDGREYEFVKDTHMGRTVLGRDVNRGQIGEHVTSYVAERILERERIIEGEWISLSRFMLDREGTRKLALPGPNEAHSQTQAAHVVKPATTGYMLFIYSIWYVLGLIGGFAVLFALAWFDLLDDIAQLLPQN